jgi:hypothetical protein
MERRLLGVALGLISLLIILLCFAYVYQNNIALQYPRKASYYCAVYPYAYNLGTSLNQTEFEQHLGIVEDLGFDGIVVHTMESFYDEGLLDWMFQTAQNHSLNVMLAIYYFNRTYHFPFPSETWNRTGFMTNDEELNLFVNYLKNVSQIAVSHSNLKGYILFYVFGFAHENRTFWMESIKTPEYQRRMQVLISALNDSKPIYLTAEPWDAERSIENVYVYLPKNFIGVKGFALQGYNFVMDDIQFDLVEKQAKYWKQCFKEIHIAEFGYRTIINDDFYHGRASSEQAKANMIKEFIKKTWTWNSFVCYFGLTYFPPDGKDWGLIYNNQTYNLGAFAFKEMLKKGR